MQLLLFELLSQLHRTKQPLIRSSKRGSRTMSSSFDLVSTIGLIYQPSQFKGMLGSGSAWATASLISPSSRSSMCWTGSASLTLLLTSPEARAPMSAFQRSFLSSFSLLRFFFSSQMRLMSSSFSTPEMFLLRISSISSSISSWSSLSKSSFSLLPWRCFLFLASSSIYYIGSNQTSAQISAEEVDAHHEDDHESGQELPERAVVLVALEQFAVLAADVHAQGHSHYDHAQGRVDRGQEGVLGEVVAHHDPVEHHPHDETQQEQHEAVDQLDLVGRVPGVPPPEVAHRRLEQILGGCLADGRKEALAADLLLFIALLGGGFVLRAAHQLI